MLARWALAGVVLAWFNSNFYPFFVGAKFGLEVVADLNVARLLFMPIALLVPAWANLFRPSFSRDISSGKAGQVSKTLGVSCVVALVGTCAYGATILLGFDLLISAFGPEYSHARDFLLAWFLYYIAFCLRNLLQSVLLLDQGGYRKLFFLSVGSFVVLWPSLFLGGGWGPVGIVFALAAIELFQCGIVWRWSNTFLRTRWESCK